MAIDLTKIKRANVIESWDLEALVKEVYELPYNVQRGEYSQESYIKVDDVNGDIEIEENYVTGMESNNYGAVYDDAEDMELTTDEEVLEHWRNHSETGENGSRRPFDNHYLNTKGEHSFWQPSEEWILNDLFNRGEIPAGNYIITIWW